MQHPRGHVDHDRAGEARRGRTGEDVPEDRRAERPADPDRALKVERLGQLGNVAGDPLDGRPRAGLGRRAVAAQVDGDDPEMVGELGLRAEEAAMRHQPVQQHERRALALVAIGDSRAVRCREMRSNTPPPAARPCSGSLRPGRLMPQSET